MEDATAAADLLWNISLSLRSPRSVWTGLIEMVQKGSHPRKLSVLFLSIIDIHPSDLTCVYSTLLYVSEHAKRYGVTPIITFDQPNWLKAVMIKGSVSANSGIKNIVLRFGGFQTEMSFLGSIGHIMADLGLKQILECVYAIILWPIC